MWDGRGDAYEPVEVPVRPAISYRLGPRWPLWLALLPVVVLLGLGAGIALVGFGSIDVLEAPIVPRTPVLTLPPSAPQQQPPSPPLASSLVPAPTVSPRADGPVVSTPPAAELTPAPDEVVSASPSSSVTTSPATTTTTMAEPEPAIPRTADDCRNGGWRELVDDTGHPFTNQGDCIRFVDREGQDP
jgi:hypothetical protein